MARFIKAVDLWDQETVAAINAGKLVLQVGQWVKCGSGQKSRFLGVKNGVFDCVHYPNVTKKFLTRAKINRISISDLTPKERRKALTQILNG